MRAAAALLAMGLCACAQTTPAASVGSPGPSASQNSPASLSPSPSPAATTQCRLPVWWPDPTTTDIHAGLLGIPGGGLTDAQTLSSSASQSSALSSFQFYGAYFDASSGWKRLNRALVSPDGSRYVYWTTAGTNTDTVHVLNVTTGADSVIYEGTVLYWPIGWTTDGIYLVHAIQPRQGAFEKLYRLDPAGGSPPQLVPGSDRHMYQWGWIKIADGAAWGIDNAVAGNDYTYSVLRLDLTTFQVATWFVGPTNDMFWPIGVDLHHGLYVGDGQQLERVQPATGTVHLTSPGPDALYANMAIDSESGFVADTAGDWLDGKGGVWFYPAVGTGVEGTGLEYPAGPAEAIVYPAAPCA